MGYFLDNVGLLGNSYPQPSWQQMGGTMAARDTDHLFPTRSWKFFLGLSVLILAEESLAIALIFVYYHTHNDFDLQILTKIRLHFHHQKSFHFWYHRKLSVRIGKQFG
jgi:hypothetical protein